VIERDVAAPAPRAGEPRPRPIAVAAIVGAALALTIWRAPQYLVAPNFWAEDGLLFFAGAWNQGVGAGLVQRPLGYLQLYSNLAASLAAWLVGLGVVPLEAAPRVPAIAGLVAQLAPIVLVATAAAPAWGGAWRRAAAVAIVLFGSRTGGIWLDATNGQYFLALAAVVVLLEPADVGRVRRRAHAVVVGLATLAGPVACFLMPLFLWKAWRTRARAAAAASIAASAGAAVQVGCLLAGGSGALAGRAHEVSPSLLAVVAWMRTIVLPVLGSGAALGFAARMAPRTSTGVAMPPSMLVGVWLVLTLGLLVVVMALGAPRSVRWKLAGAYCLVTVGSFAGALGGLASLLGTVEGGARYALVPGVLVLWLLLLNVADVRSIRGVVASAMLVAVLGTNAWQWRQTVRWKPAWPVWADQVAAWRRDPRGPLHIWPRGWTMRLAPRQPRPPRERPRSRAATLELVRNAPVARRRRTR
jgi:hypothetical protein